MCPVVSRGGGSQSTGRLWKFYRHCRGEKSFCLTKLLNLRIILRGCDDELESTQFVHGKTLIWFSSTSWQIYLHDKCQKCFFPFELGESAHRGPRCLFWLAVTDTHWKSFLLNELLNLLPFFKERNLPVMCQDCTWLPNKSVSHIFCSLSWSSLAQCGGTSTQVYLSQTNLSLIQSTPPGIGLFDFLFFSAFNTRTLFTDAADRNTLCLPYCK